MKGGFYSDVNGMIQYFVRNTSAISYMAMISIMNLYANNTVIFSVYLTIITFLIEHCVDDL